MTLNPDDWHDCDIKTADILLDRENPRIPEIKRASQDYIRKHMIENEGILQLATQIAESGGLFLHERIILIEENNKLIVVEGNRRVTASTILLRPWLAVDDEKIRKVPQINEDTKNNLTTLKCSLAKNRKVADEVIAKLHLKDLREHWTEIRQIRFVTNRLSLGYSYDDIAQDLSLSTTDVVERVRWAKILDILRGLTWRENEQETTWSDEQSVIAWDDYIKFSPFMRIIDAKECTEHFGSPLFEKNGEVSKEIYNANRIIKEICVDSIMTQKLDTLRTIRKNTAIKPYLSKYFPIESSASHNAPDLLASALPIKPTQPSSSPHEEPHAYTSPGTSDSPALGNIVPSVIPDTQTHEDSIKRHRWKPQPPSFFEDLVYKRDDNQRLTQLIHELRVVWRDLESMRYSASFLLRASFEEALYHYFISTGQLHSSTDLSAVKLLNKINALGKNSFPNSRLFDKIMMIRDRNHLDDLNCNAHNDYGNHTPERLREIAGDMKPILKYICIDHDY